MLKLCRVESQFGTFVIGEEGHAIVYLSLPDRPHPEGEWETTPLLEEARRQLLAYLDGSLRVFDLPLKPNGTPFQKKVWDALTKIPYGATASYKDVAEAVGCPKGFRAVGLANNRNPIAVFIPCHRVVGSNGSLTGYGGGLPLKQRLLALEAQHLAPERSAAHGLLEHGAV